MTSESMINVYAETSAKLRDAASLAGCTEAELVGRAVDEYTERHTKSLDERMGEAQAALARGKAAALAYSLGVSTADVERLDGTGNAGA